jgi:hypothetical protein
MIRRGDWVDRPSNGIPAMYVGTAFLLSNVLSSRGETQEAERLRHAGLEIGEATHTLDYFLPPSPPGTPAPSGDSVRQQSVPVKP